MSEIFSIADGVIAQYIKQNDFTNARELLYDPGVEALAEN
jgi:hypothetical protein